MDAALHRVAGLGPPIAGRHGLPLYDAAVVGYPQRMRDFNARQKGRRVTE